MGCKNLWKNNVLLGLAFILVSFAMSVSGQKYFVDKNQEKIKPCNLSKAGSGLAVDNLGIDNAFTPNTKISAKPKKYSVGVKPLQIISKPMAKYTDAAKQNCIEGIVTLKITFFANGDVGNIKVLKRLDYGLSDEAVKVAKLIKFNPETKNNKAVTVVRKINYRFTIY